MMLEITTTTHVATTIATNKKKKRKDFKILYFIFSFVFNKYIETFDV